ncbi:hypothetical protein DFH11DRAFT_1577745 [Phellopilus nigrolimitatus]|nr:hypothetical protein DFH11DRAFT_1577745 [Phellopilus nigrolimitatus]
MSTSTASSIFGTVRPFLLRSPPRCTRHYAAAASLSTAKSRVEKKSQVSNVSPKNAGKKPQASPQPASKSPKSKGPGQPASKQSQSKAVPPPQIPKANKLNLSDFQYAHLIEKGRLAVRMAETIPYERPTPLQYTALFPLLKGNNTLIQSTAKGVANAYLIPAISMHVEWGRDANKKSTVPFQVRTSKSKGSSALLSEIIRTVSGPASIKLIVVCPTADRALAVAAKCLELVPEKGPVNVACLTHTSTSEREREYAILRRSDVLVTTPFPILDHLINTKHYRSALVQLKCVAFDSADKFSEPKWLPALNKLLLAERVKNPAQIIVTARKQTEILKTFINTVMGSLQYSHIAT